MTFQGLQSDSQRQLHDPGLRLENKQRLNLSDRAYQTLLADSEVFREAGPSRDAKTGLSSHFINHLFRCFRGTASSSVALRLEIRKLELEERLAPITPDTAREKAISLLLADFQSQLIDAVRRRNQRGVGFSVRLEQENLTYLASGDGQREGIYYQDHIGLYLHTVLEEYAELPYAQREYIYYQELLEQVQRSVDKQKMLKLTLHSFNAGANGKVHNLLYLKPLGVQQDSEHLYNYLVGIMAPAKEGPWKPGAVRLTSIQEGKCLEQPAFISKEEKRIVETAIHTNGVQYLSALNDTTLIRVRFTPEGERMYHRMLHLRPAYTAKPKPLVYEFCCTLYQAETYFFKYGSHVKILEPTCLADTFLHKYQSAASQYIEKAAEGN